MTEIIPGRLFASSGDTTKIKADAVFNAANPSLLGGSGVDGAIHAAEEKTILADCRQLRKTQYPDELPTGQVAPTTAGSLFVSWAIHTLDPVWYGGNSSEDERMKAAYMNSRVLNCMGEFIQSPPKHVQKDYLVFFSSKDGKTVPAHCPGERVLACL